MSLDLARHWYRSSYSWLTLLLLPLSGLFGAVIDLRRALFRAGILKTEEVNVRVMVVGNISVGGTGKTPMVIWLAEWLQSLGYRPGIVSRGVGGKKHRAPYCVKADSRVEEVGDEALLLVRETGCPVVLCLNRVSAVKTLLQQTNCNVVLSDDGLQHYRLGRDIEIIMIDGMRQLGNQCLLPAGPLRERAARLSQADLVVVNGSLAQSHFSMHMTLTEWVAVSDTAQTLPLAAFQGQWVHAIAGIGHPERFFSALRQAGLKVIPHVFPDHYRYQSKDIEFQDTLPIVMTQKDAIKCQSFSINHAWFARVKVTVSHACQQTLLMTLKKVDKSR